MISKLLLPSNLLENTHDLAQGIILSLNHAPNLTSQNLLKGNLLCLLHVANNNVYSIHNKCHKFIAREHKPKKVFNTFKVNVGRKFSYTKNLTETYLSKRNAIGRKFPLGFLMYLTYRHSHKLSVKNLLNFIINLNYLAP